MTNILSRLTKQTEALKKEVVALYLACRDRQTPWYAKLITACVVAYALSPIDLIPDFIPILGYLDDLILVPIGIMLAVRLIPRPVMERCRAEAGRKLSKGEAGGRKAAVVIIFIWLALFIAAIWLVYKAVI